MNALLELDKKIFFLINGLRHPLLDYLLAWPTYLGADYALFPLLFILIFTFDRKAFIRKYLILFIALVSVDIMVEMLKPIFARPRPFDLFLHYEVPVRIVLYRPHSYSFPSGHAALAFGTAVMINYLYQNKFIWLYPLAFLVAITRIYIGVHFPSDVIGGALIGMLMAWLFIVLVKRTKFLNRKSGSSHNEKMP